VIPKSFLLSGSSIHMFVRSHSLECFDDGVWFKVKSAFIKCHKILRYVSVIV